MFARLRKMLMACKEMSTARKVLFEAGYWDAGRAVDVLDDKIRRYLAYSSNQTHIDCLGNILGGTEADIHGAFAADSFDKVPPCWEHEAYMRGYHQRLVEHFQTAFVQLELDTDRNVLPRGRIKLTVKGVSLGKPAADTKVIPLKIVR